MGHCCGEHKTEFPWKTVGERQCSNASIKRIHRTNARPLAFITVAPHLFAPLRSFPHSCRNSKIKLNNEKFSLSKSISRVETENPRRSPPGNIWSAICCDLFPPFHFRRGRRFIIYFPERILNFVYRLNRKFLVDTSLFDSTGSSILDESRCSNI